MGMKAKMVYESEKRVGKGVMDATVGIRSVDGLVTIHVLISVYVYCCVHTSSSLSLGFSLSLPPVLPSSSGT
jgi:hypothetical protein